MIEVVSRSRCVGCDLCIRVCPTDVFDRDADGIPVIARQEDCQTCFSCEIYCPVDALYVAPLTGPAPDDSPHRDEELLAATGALGAYRGTVGWGGGRTPGSRHDRNHLFTAGMTGQPGTRPAPLPAAGLPPAESHGPDPSVRDPAAPDPAVPDPTR